MSQIYHRARVWRFWWLLLLAVVPPFVAYGQTAVQEIVVPPAAIQSTGTPGLSSKVSWYQDPARMALIGVISGAIVGAIATTCAAFMTGLINLRVRKITNEHELQLRELIRQHELQKLSVQKQLEVYGTFDETIVKFTLIKADDQPLAVFDGLMDVIAAFERSYPFLDKQTIKTFDELINSPFNNQEFVKIYQERGELALYNEVRQRLMRHVLPTAREFLNSLK